MRFYHWSILSLSCTLSTQIGTARIAHKYRIKNCLAIESHCKSTSLEFTTLRMSIETGNLRLVKVRLQQRLLKYSGLFNFNIFYGAVVFCERSKITHILHYCQPCDILKIINLPRMWSNSFESYYNWITITWQCLKPSIK